MATSTRRWEVRIRSAVVMPLSASLPEHMPSARAPGGGRRGCGPRSPAEGPAVTSRPCRTTGRPCTKFMSTVAGEQKTIAATGSCSAPANSRRFRSTATKSAHLPGSSEPTSVSTEDARPAQRRHLQRLAGGQQRRLIVDRRRHCLPQARQQHRLARFGQQVRAIVAGRAIHPQPDLHARRAVAADGGDTGRQAHVRRSGSAPRRSRPRAMRRTSSASMWTACANQTSGPDQSSCSA